jgi:hypothetical protein
MLNFENQILNKKWNAATRHTIRQGPFKQRLNKAQIHMISRHKSRAHAIREARKERIAANTRISFDDDNEPTMEEPSTPYEQPQQQDEHDDQYSTGTTPSTQPHPT